MGADRAVLGAILMVIDGIGGWVRGFGGAGLGWFVVVRIGITEVRGFSGLRMPHLGWTGDGVWAVW